jgi:HSP20 family molecular chaperone IbpA
MANEARLAKSAPQALAQSESRKAATPACDIFENSEEVLLVADLPGVKTEELSIDLDKEVLTLSAPRTVASQGIYLGYECGDCDYQRRFVVPSGIETGKIRAELKNGVLSLHLPKAQGAKPRQITVTAG